jgi:Flp pilus assembly protein CpaB
VPWLLVDIALVLVALGVLGVLAWRVWRQTAALGREVRAAGDRLSSAVAEIPPLRDSM